MCLFRARIRIRESERINLCLSLGATLVYLEKIPDGDGDVPALKIRGKIVTDQAEKDESIPDAALVCRCWRVINVP
jgi:hypothetical protein